MHPHRSAVGIRAMLAFVPIVWAISIAMASPMAIWKKLEYWTDMPMGHLFDNDVGRSVLLHLMLWDTASKIHASWCAIEKVA